MSEIASQAQPQARSGAANKRIKFIIGGAVIAVAISTSFLPPPKARPLIF